MDPITIVIIAGVGGFLAYNKIRNNRKERLELETKKKREEELKVALRGVRAGVWIREPNGSSHVIQNLVEQAIGSRGAALFDLRNEHAKTLLEKGEWNTEIASGTLDVAVIGRIITRSEKLIRYDYPTVQSIDTETGRRFDQLGEDHPRYREPNTDDFDEDWIYEEPWDEFERRKEIEKVPRNALVERYTLDVRFYGPNGQIRGGCAAMSHSEKTNPMRVLVAELVNDLAETVKPSIEAHERRLSLAELEGSSLGEN